MDFLVHHNNVTVIERKITCEKHKENNPTRPRVSFRPIVAALPTDNLGSRISRGPTSRMKQAIFELFGQSRETEVGDFEVSVLVQQDILRLHIAVSDAVFVTEA